MELHPAHFVAIVGGATSGSEAASRLADRGIYSVVFEQNARPYGKIEDGLPKWHVKLQRQEEKKIDEKFSKPGVFFVPNTKLGRDIDFFELANQVGFSTILLANGAWRDRALPVEGVDKYVGKGLYYQNPLVGWFNHYHESNYDGEQIELYDDAIVVGGGLGSLDVVKIIQIEMVLKRLRERNIKMDVLTLEAEGINKVLEKLNLTMSDLELKGCTLYYRRRAKDMPLAEIPKDASPERIEKVQKTREKILNNFQNKYLFHFKELRSPKDKVVENGRLAGLVFQETQIVDGRVKKLEGSIEEVRSPLVVSSIGSVPEPIEGIDMDGELYLIEDRESGKVKNHDNVFALGNVVTGKGNIKASLVHGQQVSDHVMDYFLAWREEDYQELLDRGARDAQLKVDEISTFLKTKKLLSVEQIQSIIDKVKDYQQRVGYDGYQKWIEDHRVERIEEVIAAGK